MDRKACITRGFTHRLLLNGPTYHQKIYIGTDSLLKAAVSHERMLQKAFSDPRRHCTKNVISTD